LGKWLNRFKLEKKVPQMGDQRTDSTDNTAKTGNIMMNHQDSEPLTLDGANADEMHSGSEMLRRQGYFLMHSSILCEDIVIVESEDARRYATGHATYTLHELELLRNGYQDGYIVTLADLRLMHIAKKLFKAKIIR